MSPAAITGGCQCGRVRYTLARLPERSHICHCRMCQKAVGGPFAALASVPNADIAWTGVELSWYASSNL
ncbi:GFA family protein, partial [Clostridioides difficile]|uniref:GFA family protein n=1 Tax=Clostridioides difficile TaxID=1496 RepID=UPI0018DDB9E0